MTTEITKNIVSLFLHCQKLIPTPKRLSFSSLKSVLNNAIDEAEFNTIVKSIFNVSEHYFLLEREIHPTELLVEINKLADKLKLDINPTLKQIFMILLVKLSKENNQEKNENFNRAIYCVGEIFSYSRNQVDEIKRLFFTDEPGTEDYGNSVLLTNESPDYVKMVDGLKVIYNPEFSFKIWVKNIKSVNNMLYKIIETSLPASISELKAGDVLTHSRYIHRLLEDYKITMDVLSTKILSDSAEIKSIEIPATERSPRVIINKAENKVEIEGVSMILQPHNFFNPVFYWLEKLKQQKPKNFDLHINLSFFNTYTSKIILKVFQMVSDLETVGCKPNYYWYYEPGDDEIKEAGEHYESIIDRQFIFTQTAVANSAIRRG
jgi:hypothetical protein